MGVTAKTAKKPATERRGKPMADPVVAPMAQGDGDPGPLSMDDKLSALRAELLERIAPPVEPRDETFTSDEHGRYVAPKGSRELFIRMGGDRYEHVGETADGRWVYAKS